MYMSVVTVIEMIREGKGISKGELAEKIGITKQNMSNKIKRDKEIVQRLIIGCNNRKRIYREMRYIRFLLYLLYLLLGTVNRNSLLYKFSCTLAACLVNVVLKAFIIDIHHQLSCN